MAPSLEQEVNLSRRACRKLTLISNSSNNCHNTYIRLINENAKISDNNSKENYLIDNDNNKNNVYDHNKLVGAKSSAIQLNDDDNQLNKFHMNSDSDREIFSRQIIPNVVGNINDNNNYYKNNNKTNENIHADDSNYLNYNSQFISYISYLLKCSMNLGKLISFNKTFMILVLINVLLINCGYVMARPNSNGESSGLVDSNDNGNSLALENQPPTLTIDQMENGSPSISKESKLETAVDEHKEPHRYPVSQIDFARVETPFIIGVWILFASIAKIGFHMTPKINKIFPESSLLIVVGVIIGIILYRTTSVRISPLTPTTFFFYMLPPIILDAGYFMPNRLFFDNIGTIILMAVIGTIFNIATIGGALYACGQTGIFNVELPLLDTFLFSSLISAVDPVAVLAVFEEIHVNEILYIVVFGESLLNDAVTVVLYHMFEVYSDIGLPNIIVSDILSGLASFFVVALGGTIIGVIWGFLTGLVTRFTDHVRVIEPIFIFVMAYLAYLNAEIFHMSGILAITFCGITMKNYVEANISHKSHTTIKYALKMLSSSAETIIFMFLGVATVNNHHIWNTWFVILTVLFCSVFRVIGVILLVAIANRFRIHKLSNVDQFVMSYGGLRGAVAFALVLLIDPVHVKLQPMFVTTTIAVIYFTVFLQGITIKPLVRILNVKRANKRKPTMNERIHERFIDHMMAGLEDIVGKTGNYNVRDKFKRFDNRFIRPYLIRDLKGAEPKILETYSKLAMKDAMDYMRRNPSTIGQMSGTESMSALFRNYTGYLGGRCGTSFLGTCPSFSNLENSTRNLDMQELDYNPSKKDLTDARIHHLLAEELKPYRRHRRLSYSRHAVDDRDLSTQVNYKMHMNIRRMACNNDRKHHKRSKRGQKEGAKQNHVSFPEFQNGSAKQFANDYINEVLHEHPDDADTRPSPSQNDDWDSGLTFTAKSSPDSDGKSVNSRTNNTNTNNTNNNSNNSLIAHITSLPGFDPTKARIVKHLSLKSCQSDYIQSQQREYSALDLLPTAAETLLPWRRDKSYQCIVDEGGDTFPEDIKRFSRDSEGEVRVATPTATESTLPWKRDDGESDEGALKQNEFPAWASNKEYLAYNSPSATFLGGLNKPKQVKSVIGLFRRESSASGGAGTDTETSVQASQGAAVPPVGRAQLDKRSASIAGTLPTVYDDIKPVGHHGQFPVTASHRRNTRRGSLLEMSGEAIPEELHSKSLPDRARKGPPMLRGSSVNSPLVSTPTRSQQYQQARFRQHSQATTALLSSPSTDSESDVDETKTRPNRNYKDSDLKEKDHENDDDEDDEYEGLQMRLS